MKINILDEIIYFDEFPDDVKPMQKIFISNLLWLNKPLLPRLESSSPVQIYTSQNLWNQLLKYNSLYYNRFICHAMVTCIKPYEEFQLELDNKHHIEILMCDAPKDRSGRVMYLIKINKKIEHFYAGAFTHIRDVLLNENLHDWLNFEVETLYLSMERASETMKLNEAPQVARTIREMLSSNMASKIMINVPQFGYENLVENLTMEFPDMVGMLGSYLDHYELVVSANNLLTKNLKATKIMIATEELTLKQIIGHYTKFKMCYITFTTAPPTKNTDEVLSNAVIQLQYSAYPNALLLEMTSNVARAKRIMGIVNGDPREMRVPAYLKKYTQTLENKEDNTPSIDKSMSSAAASHNKEHLEKIPEEVSKEAIYTLKKKQLFYLHDNDSDDNAEA